jgi:hypothetical protein
VFHAGMVKILCATCNSAFWVQVESRRRIKCDQLKLKTKL